MKHFKEEDLFYPIKNFFINNGYKVNAEVKNCDIVVHKDNKLIIIELKKNFNIKLLYQAIERKKITENIYVCIPKLNNKDIKNIKNIIYILQSINIGLIVVDFYNNNKVNIILEPDNSRMKKFRSKSYRGIIKEIEERKLDLNKGGVTKIKISTAYREKSIHVACIIKKHEKITIKQLVKEYGFSKNIGSLLRNNYYNWYKKEKRGVYFLTKDYENDIKNKNFKEIVKFYTNNLYINKKYD